MYNIDSILSSNSDDVILKNFINNKNFILDLIKELRRLKGIHYIDSDSLHCIYCDEEGDCLFSIPDSKFKCKGYIHCSNYEDRRVKKT